MRRFPESYFIIIPEVINATMTTPQLVELGKAHVQSAATSSKIISETPYAVSRLEGTLVESEAQVGNYDLFYVHWYLATNGFAYQMVGYGKIADRLKIEGDLKQMLTRFELIDLHRVASSNSKSFTTNLVSPAHFYTVDVAKSAWHVFPKLGEDFSEAEFGGSQGESCFVVVPVWLGAQRIDNEALAAGFLATMNIAYPDNDFTHRQEENEEGNSRLQFDYQRTIEGTAYRYRVRIIHLGEYAYMVAAWTVRNDEHVDAILNDAIERVKSTAPKSIMLKSTQQFSSQDLKNQGQILNQAGLFYFKAEQYERGLPLFRAANAIDRTNSDRISNVLLTLSRLKRPKDGLEFLAAQPKEILEKPDLLSFKAYFLKNNSQTQEAITNYAKAFSAGYRSDEDFEDYIDLLTTTRQYDRALTEVGQYLQGGDSLTVRLLNADIYRAKHNYRQAVKFLEGEHGKAPYNSKITQQLINALLDAELPNEALVYSKELLKDDHDSYLPYYLKARCEIDLKRYREAKTSLEAAAKLEPADEDVKTSLNYVSGLLGEGNNSMLKDPIDPIWLPETLTNHPAMVPEKDFAKDYGAYYVQRIKALSYLTNTEYKITDYLRIHVVDAVGVAAFSTYQISFDPLSYDVFVNDAKVLNRSGKTISTVKSSDCYVIDEAQDGKVSQRKTLNIPIAGLQPGCDLSLVITRRSAGHQDEFPYLSQSFAKNYPTLECGVFLHGDVAGLKMRATPGIQRLNLKDGIYWSTTNPMVARWEPMQPSADTFLPMLWIADGGTLWERLATNYLASISDQLLPDKEVEQKAAELINGLTDDPTKIAVLSRYVQTNCTYKAIEFGHHSRIPRKPADTLHNMYGDCKDHAVLLQQLLQYTGVQANLALISSEDTVRTDMPSLDQFDHMIVEFPKDNEERFIDPTDKGTELASGLPIGLAEHQALVLNPAKPHVTKLGSYANDASCIHVEQHVSLLETTDLSVDETIILSGVSAAYMRDYLQGLPPTYRQEHLQRDMEMADAVMSRCDIDSLETPSQPLQIKCSFLFKNRFHHAQNGLVGTLHGGLERYYLATRPVNGRVTPFEITVPLQIHSQVVFDIPKGYHVVEQPEPIGKLDPRFVTYQSQHKIANGQLNMEYHFQEFIGRHDAVDYSTYRDTLEQVQSLIESEVDLRAD